MSWPKGGDLGWLREDQLIPAVRTAAAGLQEGAVSEPVRAPDGWHVLPDPHSFAY
jgi:parvulin-like peptidyl-prolyl isomerase